MEDQLRAQYEAYPYPPRDAADEAARLITGSPSHLAEINHYIYAGRRDFTTPFRALIAGGGTYTKPGWAYAKRAFNEFLKASSPVLDERKWVRVFEIQKDRGVPHIHALLTESSSSPRRMSMVDWCKENYGIARIFEYQKGLGAAHYLGKYLVKDYGGRKDNFDIEFGGF